VTSAVAPANITATPYSRANNQSGAALALPEICTAAVTAAVSPASTKPSRSERQGRRPARRPDDTRHR
jgi:hypothetical protein